MLVGTILQNGKYTIIEEIGQGGFGVTFKAIHHYLNQEVVMKTINERLRQNPDFPKFQRQFQDEARRLATCIHPHIVRVSDYFEEDGLPYMVMEYIPGETLHSAYIVREIPLPESTAIHYICQIGAALEVVHSQGLLHRDIKPDNIIVRQGTQEVVLIDFGIAREFNNGAKQTHTGLVSEGYSPIEQYLTQAPRTAATDVYGLAATLYALLTAEVPIPALLRERQPMPEPRDLYPHLSVAVNQAVMVGMALEPQFRPGSVREWLEMLPGGEKKFTYGQIPSPVVPTINLSEIQSNNLESSINGKVDKKLGTSLVFIGLGVALLASVTGFSMIKMFSKSDLNSTPQPNIIEPTNQSPIPSTTIKVSPPIIHENIENSPSLPSPKASIANQRKSRRRKVNLSESSSPIPVNNNIEKVLPDSNYKPTLEPKIQQSISPFPNSSSPALPSKISTPEVSSSPSLMDKLRNSKESEKVISTPSPENNKSTPQQVLPQSKKPESSTTSGVVVPTVETKENIPVKNVPESQLQNEEKSLDKSPNQDNN
jgi:serine/threonine protein kinase